MLDEQRRLVVRERDFLRVGERGVEVAQLQRLAVVEDLGELHVHLARPLRTGALFLEHRDAFGQPPRHALIRHLDRDDVRELVPERRFPVKLGRRRHSRRVHRDDTPEAGAERADHPGQADVSHSEVVVLREDLDEDRTTRRELVARGQRGERLVRQRERVLLQNRRLLAVHPQDDVAVAQSRELVEPVHHAEQVLSDDVVEGIEIEGLFDRRARGGLIACPQQVHAEIGQRMRIVRMHRQRLASQDDRFVEPGVVGGHLAGNAVDVTVVGSDRQRLADFRLEVRLLIFDVRNRREHGVCLEARRVDGERPVQRLPRFVVMAGIDRLPREENVGVDR